MWGGLRRPIGPFRVNCAILAAAFSISTVFALGGCGDPSLPSPSGLDDIGGRDDSIAVKTGNFDSAGSSIAGAEWRS
jgi:hypothetical protein